MIPVIDVVGDLLDGRPAASMSTGSRYMVILLRLPDTVSPRTVSHETISALFGPGGAGALETSG